MLDDLVVALVRELHEGEIKATVPLIDRLREIGDGRWRRVADQLVDMRLTREQFKRDVERMRQNGASLQDEAESEAWQRQRAFRRFCNFLTNRFLLELHGAPTTDEVRGLAEWLDVENLPAEPEPHYGYEPMGMVSVEPMGMARAGTVSGVATNPPGTTLEFFDDAITANEARAQLRQTEEG